MLKIFLHDGSGDKRFILVNNDGNKEPVELIEDYHDENRSLPVPIFHSKPAGSTKSVKIKDFWIPGIEKVENINS